MSLLWQTHDVVDKILSRIYDPRSMGTPLGPASDSSSRKEGLQALFYVAVSCKLLSSQALDLMWYYQEDLGPLFRCFPSDVVGRSSSHWEQFGKHEMTLLREFKPSDFNRVSHYASKIKVLGHHSPRSSEGDFDDFKQKYSFIIPLLSRSIGENNCLLPNLINLNIPLQEFRGLSWYPTLLRSPRLQSIRLTYFCNPLSSQPESPEQLSDIWSNVSSTLGNIKPEISSISFACIRNSEFYTETYDYDVMRISPGFSDMILGFKNASVLDLLNVRVDGSTLYSIISLQSIRELTLHISAIAMEEYSKLPQQPLPKLQHLSIGVENLDYSADFIRSIHPVNLKTLEVTALQFRGEFSNFHPFLRSLVDIGFETSLKSITVAHPSYAGGVNDAAQPITNETIEILSSFPNLSHIAVFLNSPVMLDEAALFRIAQIWPDLEGLSFAEKTIQSIPQISLDQLFRFTALLPRLCALDLRVNCIMNGITHGQFQSTQLPAKSKSLEYLGVWTSPISDAPSVAALLADQYPNLTRVMCDGWRVISYMHDISFLSEGNGDEEEYERLWTEVRSRILKGIFQDRENQMDTS